MQNPFLSATSRRAAAVALAAALALAAAGCSSKAKDDDKDSGDGKQGAATIKTDKGVSADTITVGALTDMTGVYATLGKSVTQAQQLYVDEVNAAGGICQRKLKLEVRDHGYNPQKAVGSYTELAPTVIGFSQFIGSPFVAAVKQRIDTQDKALVIPQAWSSHLLGSESIRQIGATYDVEMINAVEFLVTDMGIKESDKVGHVYFEGDYGESALAGAKFAADKHGLSIVEQKIKPTDQDMTAQVTALKKAGVKAILISAGPAQSASLTGVAAAAKLQVPVVGSNPTFAPQLLKTQAAPALLAMFHVAASTLPIGDSGTGPAKLAGDYEKKYPGQLLDNGVIAGYTAAATFGDALKKACESKDLTRAGVTQALLSMSSSDMGFGITHDFSKPDQPSTRESFILKPDANAKGGMVVEKPAFSAPAATEFTPAM
ncbi:ABC transporter substrate-binding protein [Streptomyces sp. NPDC051940]|uniref:ABC transporter substrate-binding protein n=1 Tax=Streptomyces sp. NPDC051940 TaxID=3155675 RepID=UPI003418BEE3